MATLQEVAPRSRFATLAAELGRPGAGPPALEPAEAAALSAALGEIPGAAYVVWADGSIACANRPGQEAHDRSPSDVTSTLRADVEGRGCTYRVTPIVTPGSPAHFLAVEVTGLADPAPRLAAAIARQRLTPRQGEVLGLLVLGESNKAIARELGCAEATVEIHVTALLRKSCCEGRCALVSRFWSEPLARDFRDSTGSSRPGLRSVGLTA
jgi:DNA-binding CsgD family transcriptional regulator